MSKTNGARSRAERRAEWRAVVEQVREAGLRPRQFCLDHGLDLARFYYWRRVFALESEADNPATHFALVAPGGTATATGEGAALELQVERGWRLRIPRGVDEATLRVVLGALGRSA